MFLLQITLRPESLALKTLIFPSSLYTFFFNFKAEQVDGEALLCMNEETLKTLVPPAGVRAKLLHKIKKLNDESTEVRTTEARPIHEDANAETVGEASSAPSVEKKR